MSPPVLRSISDSPLICKGVHYLTSRVSPYGARATRRADRRVRPHSLAGSTSDDWAFQSNHLSPDDIGQFPQTSAANRLQTTQCPSRFRIGRDKSLDQAACRNSRQEQQPPKLVDRHTNWRYGSPVAANSAAGRRNPITSRRNSAQITTAGVFFRLRFSVMAAVCGQASAWPGAYCPGIPTPHTAATQSRRKDGGGSIKVGATPMQQSLNPSAIQQHAAAWKARAMAALRADSSLSVRLNRYNSAMARARALEAQEADHA